MKKIQTCVNRMLKECKDCILDYNQNNHPNNFDCKNYQPVNIRTFYVEEKKQNEH